MAVRSRHQTARLSLHAPLAVIGDGASSRGATYGDDLRCVEVFNDRLFKGCDRSRSNPASRALLRLPGPV